MSPAPTGHEPQDETFLLRMTGPEKAHLVKMAKRYRQSMNAVLRDLIGADMADERRQELEDARRAAAAAPPPAPAAPKAPKTPQKGTGGRREGTAKLTWSDVADPVPPIKGQTSITDPEQ